MAGLRLNDEMERLDYVIMDSRFHLKLTFKIYGKVFPWDCSLNWTSDSDYEIDRRITDFFLRAHDEAKQAWDAEMEVDRLLKDEEHREARERSELARLLEKYDMHPMKLSPTPPADTASDAR